MNAINIVRRGGVRVTDAERTRILRGLRKVVQVDRGPSIADGDKGAIAVSQGVWHFMRTKGAKHDGTSDDAPYLQDVQAAGKMIVLPDDRPTLIKSPIVFTEDDTGIIAPMGASVTISMASGAFDNVTAGDRLSITTAGGKKYACPFYANGVQGLRVEGLKIRPSAWTDCRYLTPLAIIGCDDAKLIGNDIGYFSRSSLVFFRDCDDLLAELNRLHHTYTLSPFEADGSTPVTSANVQICGFEGDDGAVTGSKRFRFLNNRIHDLTNGALILAALGNVQSDALNIKGTDGKSADGEIIGNKAWNVAEGFDLFCWNTLVAKNHLTDIFGAAIKLFHSCSFCDIDGNIIDGVGLAGIYSGGSNSSELNSKRNWIHRNRISGVNQKRSWVGADGNDFYTSDGSTSFWTDTYAGGVGTITAGIRIDVLGQLITNIVKTTSTSVTITYQGSDIYSIGQTRRIGGVEGMTQINDGAYPITATNPGANTITVTTPDNTSWGAFSLGAGVGKIAASSQSEDALIEDNQMDLGGNADRGVFMEGGFAGFRNLVGRHEITGLKADGRRYQDSGDYIEFRDHTPARIRLTDDQPLDAVATAQPIFENGTYTAENGDVLAYKLLVIATGLSSTSGDMSVDFGGGTASFLPSTAVLSIGKRGTGLGTPQAREFTSASVGTVASASVQTSGQVAAQGILAVNAGGTIVLRITFSQTAGASPVIEAGSYVEFTKISARALSGPGVS